MKKILILLPLFLIPWVAYAQILNMDREAKEDSLLKKWAFIGAFTFSTDKQKVSLFDASSNIELDRNFKNRYSLISILRNDAVYNGPSQIQNEGQLQLRYRDMDTRKVSAESFVQYQWNGAWGMEYRYLTGGNVRFKLAEKKGLDFYTGIGFFREWERWNWTGVKKVPVPDDAKDVVSQLYRLNTYGKFSIKLSDRVDISSINYIQFPLSGDFFNPRWYLETKLFVEASKHINFLIHWDHIYDLRRVVPIDNFYYTFSTGIQLNY